MEPMMTDSKLVSFFYELLRDRVPPSKVEAMVRAVEQESTHKAWKLSNGHLAAYAVELVDRLSDAEEDD
jgi:hypothetical protein